MTTAIPKTYRCPWIKGSNPEEPGRYWVSLSVNPHEKHLVTYTGKEWDAESAKVIANGHGVIKYTPADVS